LATSFRDQDDNVYIAVMTGFEPPFDRRLLGSIDDFLSKPIDYKFLQSKLLMWSIQANRVDETVNPLETVVSELRE
jgi:hypothetical protein